MALDLGSQQTNKNRHSFASTHYQQYEDSIYMGSKIIGTKINTYGSQALKCRLIYPVFLYRYICSIIYHNCQLLFCVQQLWHLQTFLDPFWIEISFLICPVFLCTGYLLKFIDDPPLYQRRIRFPLYVVTFCHVHRD